MGCFRRLVLIETDFVPFFAFSGGAVPSHPLNLPVDVCQSLVTFDHELEQTKHQTAILSC